MKRGDILICKEKINYNSTMFILNDPYIIQNKFINLIVKILLS